MQPIPFTLYEPPRWNIPLVLSAPHAGIEIPRGFIMPDGHAGQIIRSMSDTGIDQLALPSAQAWGFPVLSSRFLRAFIDLNRHMGELDPLLIDGLTAGEQRIEPGSRVAAGLGLIPRLADPQTPIYSKRLSLRAVQSRIERYYSPYHTRLADLVSDCQSRFGCCLLIDLHSMPPVNPALARRCLSLTDGQPAKKSQRFPQSPLNFVIGTNFGKTLPSDWAHQIQRYWQDCGLTVSMNRPYAGGHITAHHGKQINAVQLEICRGLYPGQDVSATSKEMERLFTGFVGHMISHVIDIGGINIGNHTRKQAAE